MDIKRDMPFQKSGMHVVVSLVCKSCFTESASEKCEICGDYVCELCVCIFTEAFTDDKSLIGKFCCPECLAKKS